MMQVLNRQTRPNPLRHIRRCGLLGVLSFCVILASVSDGFFEETKPTLLIADNDWRPWFNGPANIEKPGFAKEIMARCVEMTGYKSTFRHFPIKRMISMMQNGQMDVSIFSFKPERTKFLAYSKEPLFNEFYLPFARKDSGVSIKDLSDFDPLRVGHLAGLTYSKDYFSYIKKREKNRTLDVTIDSESNIKKLASRRIDVFVDTRASVTSLLKRMDLAEKIHWSAPLWWSTVNVSA